MGLGTRIERRLVKSIGAQRYETWFDASARLGDWDPQRRVLVIEVHHPFVARQIEKHVGQDIRAAAAGELGGPVELEYRANPGTFADAGRAATASAPEPRHGPKRHNGTAHRGPGRLVGGAVLRHRLEQFVVGPSNELAYAAACRMAEDESSTNHPLFIHGACGLGKTHLAQGVCMRMLKREPTAKVLYTTGEQFTNEYITAVRQHRLESFRKRIRGLDLLAVDDVHFIATREKTQAEFLHSFDDIERDGARVVLASDCHPKLIKQFTQGLVSRCLRGMVVQVHRPDLETRCKLVRVLAERRGMTLLPSVVHAIADRCVESVREIEGMLTQVHAVASLPGGSCRGGNGSNTSANRQPIGHAVLHRVLESGLDHMDAGPVRFEAILDTVVQRLGVSAQQVAGRGRHKHVVLARSLVAHLARELTPMSYPEITRAMGRRAHSTLIAADQRMRTTLEANRPVMLPTESAPITPTELLASLRRQVRRGAAAR